MKKLIFALIAGSAVMTAAQAQTITGPYVGIGASGADREYNVPGATMNNNGGYKFGGKVFAGAQVHENFGAEIGYTDFRKAGGNYTLNGANVNTENEGYGAYIAAKGAILSLTRNQQRRRQGPSRADRPCSSCETATVR